jgi:DNA-binding transcriptional regulator LsrR (DeoR family)
VTDWLPWKAYDPVAASTAVTLFRVIVRGLVVGVGFGATMGLVFDARHPVREGVFFGVAMGCVYGYESIRVRRNRAA